MAGRPKIQEDSFHGRKPNSFCETPEEGCDMNYCDDNGCMNRKRCLVAEHPLTPQEAYSIFKNKEENGQ